MFRKIVNTFGTRTVTAVINLLIAIIISQRLGAEGKGEQGLIITTVAFILVFANLVGGATLVYLTPRYKPLQLILPSYAWSIITGVAGFAFLHLVPIIDSKYIIDICILAVISSFASVNSSLLIGKEKIVESNTSNLLTPVFTIGVLLLWMAGFGKDSIQSYILALYIAYGASFAVSTGFVMKFFSPFTRISGKELGPVMGDLLRYGFLNQVAHITQMLSFRLSYYLLDHFHGEAEVGVYSNAISLAESIWLISKSISLVQYARIANSRDHAYAASVTVKLIKASVIISALFLIPLLLFPVDFYVFLFGDGFEGIKPVIWLLAPGVLIYNISILAGHYFSGLGKYNVNAVVSSIGLIVSVGVYFLFIPGYREAGAGLATTVSYAFTSTVLLVLFLRHGKLKPLNLVPGKDDLLFLRHELKGFIARKKSSNK